MTNLTKTEISPLRRKFWIRCGLAALARPQFVFWALVGGLVAGIPAVRAADAEFVATQAEPTIKVGEFAYLDAARFLERYALDASWVTPGKRQRFSSAWTKLEFEADSREVNFNGLRLFLGAGVLGRQGRLWISQIDAEKLLAPLLKPATYVSEARPVKRIVLDAGHGGKDGGTGNAKLKLQEKRFTIDVVKRLGAILKSQGFTVLYTRTDDTYIGLTERATIATAEKADLFVSVHFNATESAPNVRGLETYVVTPQHQRSTSSAKPEASDHTREPGNKYDAWNAVLGYQMHRAVNQKMGTPDRGLKRARFVVLRLAPCPAVLVEGGYLSNEAEARKIASAEFRSDLAEAIANGVANYVDQVSAVRRP